MDIKKLKNILKIKKTTRVTPSLNWHVDFMLNLAKISQPKIYVELGIYQCELFNQLIPYCEYLIGVDINKSSGNFMEKSKKTFFYNGTTKDFANYFLENPKEIDMIFIDADHSKEAVLNDFFNFANYVKNDGLIILHDTYPKDIRFTDQKYCGDCYKAIETIQKKIDKYEMVTIPVIPGLTIVRKRISQVVFE